MITPAVRAVPAVCLDLIHEFEQGPHGGFASRAYADPTGNWTIGWGHRITAREALRHAVISQETADAMAETDLAVAAAGVCRAVPDDIIRGLTDNQYGALVDLTFNIGTTRFAASTLALDLKRGAIGLIPEQIRRWVYSSGKILPGLQRRRAREAEMWELG